MLNLKYAEFYITNVCNLNCTNCNRFNNYAFKGHQRWQDYAEIYTQWAKVLHIDTIGILGGEPLLNPDFPQWVDGIATLWPNSKVAIVTNATQIKRWPNLHKQLQKYHGRVFLDISLHGHELAQSIEDQLDTWLVSPITTTVTDAWPTKELWESTWTGIAASGWPECNSPSDLEKLPQHIRTECESVYNLSFKRWTRENCIVHKTDATGVTVMMSPAFYFDNSTVVYSTDSGSLTLNRSNPDEAIEVCGGKSCHHFIRGKLYKCGPVGVLPEFVEQFKVDVSDKEKQLINSYVPADVSWNYKELAEFVNELKECNSIPQCTFCPSSLNGQKNEAGVKKIKVVKLKR